VSVAAHPDPRRHKLRALIATLERELDAMPTQGAVAAQAACKELVAAMDLGPEPAVRACPGCGALGMAGASRCGHCWANLPAAH
jgi:hypothetical protein